MLIELDTISGSGSEIDFVNRTPEVNPFVISRPNSLPLNKKSSFYPTLPPTPEFIPHRDRSYCSLPDNKRPETPITPNGAFLTRSRPHSCVITSRSSPYIVGLNDSEGTSCCWRMFSSWQKLLGKSPPRRDVIVNCDVISRSKKLPTSLVYRRRAATVQPFSLFGKENKREWGEERHDDVIYSLTLKRIRRAPSPSREVSDGLQWETHKVRRIKGATLPYLVGQLCQSFVDDSFVGDWGDRNFLTVFLATYRSFATAEEVLDQIIKENENLRTQSQEKRVPVIRSIERVLRTWLERYFDVDFYDPPHHRLLKKIMRLAEENEKEEGEDSPPLITTSPECECDFVTYLKSKLQSAEVKGLQEEAFESMNTNSHYSDMMDETENISVEEDALNAEAAKTFLHLLSPQQIAEQLTVKDATLFLRVVPHHCLNQVRSSKDKPATVKATIDQFNRVVYCVLGTCLCPSLKTSQRAKILCKWIEVAQECRELKNFSSLRAIVSVLHTHAIHRLKRTWQQVPTAHTSLLQELEQINMKDLIMKVGTAKVNMDKSSISRVRKDATTRRQRTMHSGIMHGTVPYLGSFLTDLTYLHTAKPDYIEKKLINFSKRRKEFELLAQLQLWQASCRSYQHIESDTRFSDWFNLVTLPTDEQAVQLSEEIEPPNCPPLSPTPSTPIKRSISELLANQSTAILAGLDASFPVSHTRSSSNELVECSSTHSSPSSSKSNGQAAMLETPCDEGRKINVQIIKKKSEKIDDNKPKEMKLSSNDRSPAFMKKAFGLFDLKDEDVHNFSLLQILPGDKELLIPDNGNVFYAMNSSTDQYNFMLLEDGADVPREKRDNRTQTLPLSHKHKKLQRKTVSTSSMGGNSSPMKSIYRHLALGGMSLSSGSYSPAREVQKRECNVQEENTEFSEFRLTPENERRGISLDDSAITPPMPPSESSFGYESDDSSWSHRMKKLVRRGKGHQRNHSYSGQVQPELLSNADMRPRTQALFHRPASAIILPINVVQPIIATSRPADEYRWSSAQSDVDGQSIDVAVNSTWPRNRVVYTSGEPRLHRRSAIRKHHSHPREASAYGVLSDFQISYNAAQAANAKGNSKSVKKSGSRSKFYIHSGGDNKSIESHSSSESMDPIQESESDEDNIAHLPPKPRAISRSSSGPLCLESTGKVDNDVFGDNKLTPRITVQSPSPKKSISREWGTSKTSSSSETSSVGENTQTEKYPEPEDITTYL